MDPLSVTLSVVTLTTAVKDLVEVGQKIHESFAKVSNNFSSAKRVAAEIKEMLEEIQVFCQDHQDVLADMNDFRLALQGLLDKFRSFERSILPLLPQTGGSKGARLVRGWAAWRDNNKIEKSILDLQRDIVKVIRKYVMKSAMRTEIKLETVHRETSQGIKNMHQDISQGFEVVRRDVSTLRTIPTSSAYQPLVSGSTTDDLVRNIIMFANSTPSTSAPMFRAPDIITEELMSTAYIKLQINGIVMSLERISKSAASASNSITLDTVEKFQMTLNLDHTWMTTASLRRHVVQQVTSIRDLLDADLDLIQIISIRDGARALNKLSLGLGSLDMRQESILVGNWAIALARTLIDSSCNRQLDLRADLVQYLLDQSVQYYTNIGDWPQSRQSIEEAYAISQDLRNQDPQDLHFKLLHSSVLLQYTPFWKIWAFHRERSMKMTLEAIQILEEILNVQAFTQSESDEQYLIEQVARPSATFLNTLFSSAPPITALRNYALALQQLSTSLSRDEHPHYKSAENLTLLAIAVHRNIVSIHGHVHKVDLAIALCLPAQKSRLRDRQQEMVYMANESIQLLRLLVERNPLSNARQLLISVLEAKPRLSSSYTEEKAFWEEALADRHFQDSESSVSALRILSKCFRRLKRHNDAVRTTKLQLTKRSTDRNEALAYFELSKDLLQVQRYQESIEAARSSVALFRRLAIKDSSVCERLAMALSNLAHCMAASADYSEASLVWKSCMNILDSSFELVTKPKEIMGPTAFYHHPRFSYILQDEEECLKVCSTAVRYLRQLLRISSPKNYFVVASWLLAEFCYSYNLVRIGRLQHGQQYIEDSSMYCSHWFDTNQGKQDAFSESGIAAWHSVMANLRADGLNAQGYTERAVLHTQDTQETLKRFVSTCQLSFFQMIISMVQEARLRVNLDSGNKALRIAEVALQLSQDRYKPELISTVESLAWSLHGVAFTALSIQNYTRAAEAAREGCSLCSSAGWKILDTFKPRNTYLPQTNDEMFVRETDEDEHNIFLRPGLFAFLSSAEANLGRYGNGVEYARRAVEISLDIQKRKAYISATTAESSYMETRGNLAEVLLAVGDFVQAREICEEQRAYFSKRVETRTGEYRDLAPILHMLGILYCNEGRHEEGNDAMEELSRIVKRLGIIFPELEKQVKYRLRSRLKVPILKVLEDMRVKLDCEHQVDIELLCTL